MAITDRQIRTWEKNMERARQKARSTHRRSDAIRAHCMECIGGMYAEIKDCTAHNCALYPFRLGREDKSAWEKAGK